MSDFKELLNKSIKNIDEGIGVNTVKFQLCGKKITKPIRWTNLSWKIVDSLYEGDLTEFFKVFDRIAELGKNKNKADIKKIHSLGISGLPDANLAIVWGTLAGGGLELTYREAQELTTIFIKDEKALSECWKAMVLGDIQPEDLKKIKTSNSSKNTKKKIQKKQ